MFGFFPQSFIFSFKLSTIFFCAFEARANQNYTISSAHIEIALQLHTFAFVLPMAVLFLVNLIEVCREKTQKSGSIERKCCSFMKNDITVNITVRTSN